MSPIRKLTVNDSGDYDVAQPLLKQFAMIDDGDTVEFPAYGHLLSSQILELRGRRGLRLQGRGCRLHLLGDGDRKRGNLRLINPHDIQIHDLYATGANEKGGLAPDAWVPALEAQHCFEIISGSCVYLFDCGGDHPFGDLVYVGGNPIPEVVLIRGFTGGFTGRNAFSCTGGRAIRFDRGDIHDIRRTVVNLENASTNPAHVVDDFAFEDTRVGPARLNFVSCHTRNPVDRVSIARNRLDGKELAITVKHKLGGRLKDWSVVDNRSKGAASGNNALAAMQFADIDGLDVLRNHGVFQLRGGAGGPQPRMFMARTVNCTDETIEANTGVNMIGQVIQ